MQPIPDISGSEPAAIVSVISDYLIWIIILVLILLSFSMYRCYYFLGGPKVKGRMYPTSWTEVVNFAIVINIAANCLYSIGAIGSFLLIGWLDI